MNRDAVTGGLRARTEFILSLNDIAIMVFSVELLCFC